MNLFKKKNIGEHMFREPEMREQKVAKLFRDARVHRSAVEDYWQKMRSYYDGTHETARKKLTEKIPKTVSKYFLFDAIPTIIAIKILTNA